MNRKRTLGENHRTSSGAARRNLGQQDSRHARAGSCPESRPWIVDRDGDAGHKPSRDHPAPDCSGPGQPFRVLIAIHRPRYRTRAERAASLVGWRVQTLLNKQDPVGQCAIPPRPPDILVMSEDFGRQRDSAIFRAVQQWRSRGMQVICLLDADDDATEADAGTPADLCDIMLTPPYTCAALRTVLMGVYERLRGQPAPPPIKLGAPAAVADDTD